MCPLQSFRRRNDVIDLVVSEESLENNYFGGLGRFARQGQSERVARIALLRIAQLLPLLHPASLALSSHPQRRQQPATKGPAGQAPHPPPHTHTL